MKKNLQTGKGKNRWYAVFALSSASLVDSMESFAFQILWPYMYRSLGVAVSALAPVLSIGRFVNVITTPIWGYFADRFSRKVILIAMTGIWGLWTSVLFFVKDYSQFMAVRIASSLGLAVLYPAALSLISDLYHREERGKAVGFMNAAGYAGSMVSMVVLGMLAETNPEAWRYGFLIMGLLSFLTGLLLIGVKEPLRGEGEPEISDVLTQETAFKIELRLIPQLALIPSFWVCVVTEMLNWIGFSILSSWAFTWLEMLDLGGGIQFAMLMIFVGVILGHVFFGWLSDRMDHRMPERGRAVLGQFGLVLNAAASFIFLLYGGLSLASLMVSGLVVGLSFGMVTTGSRVPIMQNILPPQLRATGRSLTEMIMGLTSAGAITFTGWLLARMAEDLQKMMLSTVPVFIALAIFTWIPIFKTYPRDIAILKKNLEKRREEIIENQA